MVLSEFTIQGLQILQFPISINVLALPVQNSSCSRKKNFLLIMQAYVNTLTRVFWCWVTLQSMYPRTANSTVLFLHCLYSVRVILKPYSITQMFDEQQVILQCDMLLQSNIQHLDVIGMLVLEYRLETLFRFKCSNVNVYVLHIYGIHTKVCLFKPLIYNTYRTCCNKLLS